MWNRKRALSMALGIAMATTSLTPPPSAYAAEIARKEYQKAKQEVEEKVLEVEKTGTATASNADKADKTSVATLSNALKKQADGTHLAVYAGTLPDIETEKELDVNDFLEPYSTVSVTAVDGTEYTVEVVPENIVYFVDSAAGETSPSYEAVAELAGSALKNEAADAAWSDGADWGYTGRKANKGNTNIEDKEDTGFYGESGANHPITYRFALEAGTYTITSAHKDWWNKDRPMSMTISHDGEVEDAGSVNATGINEFTFKVKDAQTVTYTINNTGWEAALVSWVAIVQDSNEVTPDITLSEPLEDNEKVSVRNGASLEADFTKGKMITVSSDWISGGNSPKDGGGVINDAESYFAKEAFTLYTDFLFNEAHDNTSALLIGNEENHIRLIPKKTDGKAVLRVHTGGTDTDYTIDTSISQGKWHAVAVLYSENEEQGMVSLCLDGIQILTPVGIGFKFSEQTEITAGYGITYKTGFMRTGNYDNIVVGDGMAAVSDAKKETAARVKTKNSISTLNQIVIDGSAVEKAAKNMNGLTFKGFGVLDANSTNALLLDYKAQQPEKYWEMMEVLFGGEHPIMQHIKIEMGNDKNNSTGSQACTMRYSDEYPDVTRVTGFQLAADAKKINPNVKVSLLYWRAPGWVGSNWNNLYKWMKNTAIAAYREYGYMLDMISPGMNESPDDPNWIKQVNTWLETDTEGMISSDASAAGFHSEEEAELLHKIQIIMSDEVGIATCGQQLMDDEALRNAVEIVGYHYNTDDDGSGNFKKLAEQFDMEIWNSEAQATFGSTADRPNNNMADNADPGTGIGGNGGPLEMANTVIKGFVNSRRTHFVYQPTFGAFYEGTQYNYKDVMAARDPWSGYVNYDGALNIMQHFTKFAVTGWEYDTPDENVVWRGIPSASKSTATGTNPVNGRNGGDNYMTLAAPDKSAFSVIISNDSGKEKSFTIRPQDLELGENAQLEVWETRAADNKALYNGNYMKCVETLSPKADGSYVVDIKPWSIVTVTSLDMDSQEGALALPTASEDGRYVLDTDETGKKQDTTDGYLYVDDFDYKDMGNLLEYDPESGELVESGKSFIESRGGADGFYPLYTQDTNGTFEVVMKEDGNGVLKMNGQTGGSCWNGGEPATIIGDYRWTNYKVSADFNLNSSSEYLLLGARQRGAAGGGDNKVSMCAYNIALNRSGSWILRRHSSEIARGTVSVANPEACNVALRVAGDTVTAYIEGEEVYTYTDANPQLEGRIMLGVGLPGEGWGAGEFDNLKVETVPGYTPYFTMIHDNLHMKKWDGEEAGTDALVYEGSWSHINQKGSQYSQRSLSSTSEKGASVSYTFEGTGFALIGENGGSAKVNVEVDGEMLYTDAPTIATNSHQPYLVVRGLENGTHTVTVSLASGRLDVDSFGYITANETISSQTDMTELTDVLAAMNELKAEDYSEDSWQAYQDALAGADAGHFSLETTNRILADPVSYGADQESIHEIAAHFEAMMDILLRKDAPIEITSLENLPKMLAVTVGGTLEDIKGGQLPAAVSVKNADGTTNDSAEIIWKLSGSTNQAYRSISVTGTVTGGKSLTVTIPVEVVPSNLVYFIDPGTEDASVYNLYKDIFPELKNDTNDAVSENGSWGRNEAGTKANTNPMDKLDTGIYSGNGITYTLPLEAGIYTITAGFKEWWGYDRNMSQTITYTLADGTVKTLNGDTVTVGQYGTAENTTAFILPQDATITYTLAKKNNQDAVLSWLAVAEAGTNEECSWEPIFISNETNAWDGILTQGTVVTQDDPEQGEVLHMNAAGTTYAQLDPNVIDFTGRENLTMSFDLKSETADGNFFTVAIGQDSNKYFFLRTRKNDSYIAITKGSWGAEQKGSVDIDTYNKWVHVDLVFTPEKMITYMDGVPVISVDKTILMTDLGSNPIVYLGKSFYSNDNYFAGAFDNIAVYNRARSAEELELSYLIGKAEKLSMENYTADSWSVFAAALKAAQTVQNNASAAAEERTSAKTALQEAMDALVEGTNMTDLAEAVAEAEKLNKEEYTPSSFAAVEAALAAANDVLSNPSATKEEKDAAKNALADAVAALVKKADKKDLQAAVKDAQALNKDEYTADSFAAVEKAMQAANSVLQTEDATQDEVAEAVKALEDAVNALVKKSEGGDIVDMTDLKEAVAETEKLNKEEYTPSSFAAVEAALAAANDVLSNPSATKEEKDAAKTALADAVAALVKKADKKDLQAAVKDAQALNKDEYTADSFAAVEKAMQAANSVLQTEDATQDEVAEAVKALENAVKALVKKQPQTNPSHSSSHRGVIHTQNQQQTQAPVIMTGTIPSDIRSGYWKKADEQNWKLVKEDGTYAKSEWALINKHWYLFDNNEIMVRGWAKVNDTWYYFDQINGNMKAGWQLVNDKWYYLDTINGDMKTGWLHLNDKWYYLDPVNGDMKSGKIQIDNTWYDLGEPVR